MAGIIYSRTGGCGKRDRARATGLARLAHCLEGRRSENESNTNSRSSDCNMSFYMYEHGSIANASWAGMAERLGLMNRRLENLGLDPPDDLGRDH